MKNPVLMVFNPAIVKVIEDKRNKKKFIQFLRVHSFHSSLVDTTFIWQISSCRAPTSAVITFHQI